MKMILQTRTYLILVLQTFISYKTFASEASPIVSVSGGKIVGTKNSSATGQVYFSFRGVPYAGPISGADNRFKPPTPIIPWEDELAVNKPGEYCAQSARGWRRGVEDCLHLSVYTPEIPSLTYYKTPGDKELKPMPVLVWFHGGSFVSGGAADYDPTFLMSQDMVVVVPQYRLGLFGFMYAMENAPGNYGMLDQVAALKWVQINIAKFGGDPNHVTIGGDDAGGASAFYHMLSPNSKGLFHGVISVSGTPLNPWARHLISRQSSMVYAYRMGCPRYSSEALIKCFKTMEIEKILESQPMVLDSYQRAPDLMYIGSNNNAPVVQNAKGDRQEQHFITSEPLFGFGQGTFAEVPVLMITSKDEGNYVVNNVLDKWIRGKVAKKVPVVDEEIMKLVAEFTGVICKTGEKVKQLWDQYLPGMKDKSYDEKLQGIAEMLGDALHNAGVLQTAKYINDKVPTYLFRFDFDKGPHVKIYNTTSNEQKVISDGAGHGDVMNYFLPKDYKEFETKEQKRAKQVMTNIISNFVSGKLPTEKEWPRFTDEKLETMVLKEDASVTRESFLTEGRQKTSEMIFNDHFRSQLGLLKRLLPRDEL